MKAWLLESIGGLDRLRLTATDDPVPAAGEVVLAVRFAALNPADRYLAEGQYPAKPTFPHILGRDGIGEVVAVGEGVTGVAVGESRMILRGDTGVNRRGTFAERVAVAADSLVSVPAGWTDPEAAGATLVYLTAFQALTQFGELPPSVVLVTGASGGVGVASVQLARAMGHTVVALSRSAAKQQALKELGAEISLDPTPADWPRRLKAALHGRRVDLAIDNIGGTLLPRVIETLGDRGKVSCVGRLAGPVPEFNTATLFFRRVTIGGIHVGSYGAADGKVAWQSVVDLLQRTASRPLVDHVFAFDQLLPAFERLKEGPMGKVLLATSYELSSMREPWGLNE